MDKQGVVPEVTPKSGHVRLRLQTRTGRWVNVGPFGSLAGARRMAEDLLTEQPPAVRSVCVQHKNRATWKSAWSWTT